MAGGISFTWENIQVVEDKLSAIASKMASANTLAVTLAANIVKKNAQTGLALRSHPRGTWTPSPPGDAPALVTGALRRSITVNMLSTGSIARAEVGPTIIYGRIQELGGQTGRGHAVTLPARPYMAPALEYSIPEMTEAVKSAWLTAFEV